MFAFSTRSACCNTEEISCLPSSLEVHVADNTEEISRSPSSGEVHTIMELETKEQMFLPRSSSRTRCQCKYPVKGQNQTLLPPFLRREECSLQPNPDERTEEKKKKINKRAKQFNSRTRTASQSN